jgi:hypothetical protein
VKTDGVGHILAFSVLNAVAHVDFALDQDRAGLAFDFRYGTDGNCVERYGDNDVDIIH